MARLKISRESISRFLIFKRSSSTPLVDVVPSIFLQSSKERLPISGDRVAGLQPCGDGALHKELQRRPLHEGDEQRR